MRWLGAGAPAGLPWLGQGAQQDSVGGGGGEGGQVGNAAESVPSRTGGGRPNLPEGRAGLGRGCGRQGVHWSQGRMRRMLGSSQEAGSTARARKRCSLGASRAVLHRRWPVAAPAQPGTGGLRAPAQHTVRLVSLEAASSPGRGAVVSPLPLSPAPPQAVPQTHLSSRLQSHCHPSQVKGVPAGPPASGPCLRVTSSRMGGGTLRTRGVL